MNQPPWLAQLAPHLPNLLGLARDNADPGVYASVVVDNLERKLPVASLAAVETAAKDPGFVDTVIAALPPSCQPYREWFTALVRGVQTELNAPAEPAGDDDDPGAAG